MGTVIPPGPLLALPGRGLVTPPATYKVAAAAAKPNVRRHDIQFTYGEMLRTPQFYFLFVAMLSVAIGGLEDTPPGKPGGPAFGISPQPLDPDLVLYPPGTPLLPN